ncbi:MAG: four-carbon acid sugar kinase family protein [Thermomicrobiales bacterium]|nr:four-carbon acid sugar kinase family protein [Thermomicrobiales bacterium]
MDSPQLVIIADDLTGAADTAGALAGRGFSVALCLDQQPAGGVDVLSFSADTRDAPRQSVTKHLDTVIDQGRRNGEPSRWYHKIDSALRGHPGPELRHMMDRLDRRVAIVCPALPSQGRTVIGGQIRINGLPLHDSPMSEGKTTSHCAELLGRRDGESITTIDLARVRRGATELAAAIGTGTSGIWLIDAETDQDLQIIAAAIKDNPAILPAGSAGLATAMGASLAHPQSVPPQISLPVSPGPALLVVGSAHPASAEQVRVAEQRGARVIRPTQVERVWNSSEQRTLCVALRAAIEAGTDTIVTLSGCPRSPLAPQFLARQLANVVGDAVGPTQIGGFVLTGGEIAAAVCNRIGAGFLWLRGEVAPAVPWGVIGAGDFAGLPVVTKAGSFGAPEVLCRSVDLMRGLNR